MSIAVRFSIIFMLLVAVIFGTGYLSTSLTYAQDDSINKACLAAPDSPVCKDLRSVNDPVSGNDGLFSRVFNVLSLIAGIIAVIIFIVGGIQMMTADGDPQKFNNARNLFIYASVGIAIVGFAQIIIRFIVYSLVG